MFNQLTHSIIPWLLGGLAIMTIVSIGLTLRFWRESKRSPYFFLRRQAEQNMQTYSLASLSFLVGTLFLGTYAQQAPQDLIIRMSLIPSAKPAVVVALVTPVVEEVEPEATPEPQIVAVSGSYAEMATELAAISNLAKSDERFVSGPSPVTAGFTIGDLEDLGLTNYSAKPSLPDDYNQFEPEAELTAATQITELTFSPEVDNDYNPLNPARLYKEGFFTVYATFDYSGMEDGMAWSWIWRHDGEVVSGGNELWNYGDEGPGYVYLNPEEGFQVGEYTVEVWVNGQLMGHASIFVVKDVAAGN